MLDWHDIKFKFIIKKQANWLKSWRILNEDTEGDFRTPLVFSKIHKRNKP